MEKQFLRPVLKDKYAKRTGVIALIITVFGIAGIIGTVLIYQHQNKSNYKVNISGRQRFLSAMILIDLQKLENDKSNDELVKSINQRRNLFREGMTILNIDRPQMIEGLQRSQFANEKTPVNDDIYSDSINYYTLTFPDVEHLGGLLPVIREKQRQTIGAVWDTYTGKLAYHFDLVTFRMMLFVVFCFSIVVAFSAYAIASIISIDRENKEHKHILQSSSKFVSLGEQTVNINHDMNNILSVIMAFMTSFKVLIEDRPELIKKFSVLEKSVARLSALTAALRRSIIGGPETSNEEKFTVLEIVEDCKIILRDKLATNGVRLLVEVPEDFNVTMRKDFLYQLLLNLISNAVEAVALQENAWVKIQAENNNGELLIKVIDSGNGLPPDVKEKLFTPFFTTKVTGSGLGLNYLRRMAEEMQGQLVYDETSVNTCFVFKWRHSS